MWNDAVRERVVTFFHYTLQYVHNCIIFHRLKGRLSVRHNASTVGQFCDRREADL